MRANQDTQQNAGGLARHTSGAAPADCTSLTEKKRGKFKKEDAERGFVLAPPRSRAAARAAASSGEGTSIWPPSQAWSCHMLRPMSAHSPRPMGSLSSSRMSATSSEMSLLCWGALPPPTRCTTASPNECAAGPHTHQCGVLPAFPPHSPAGGCRRGGQGMRAHTLRTQSSSPGARRGFLCPVPAGQSQTGNQGGRAPRTWQPSCHHCLCLPHNGLHLAQHLHRGAEQQQLLRKARNAAGLES